MALLGGLNEIWVKCLALGLFYSRLLQACLGTENKAPLGPSRPQVSDISLCSHFMSLVAVACLKGLAGVDACSALQDSSHRLAPPHGDEVQVGEGEARPVSRSRYNLHHPGACAAGLWGVLVLGVGRLAPGVQDALVHYLLWASRFVGEDSAEVMWLKVGETVAWGPEGMCAGGRCVGTKNSSFWLLSANYVLGTASRSGPLQCPFKRRKWRPRGKPCWGSHSQLRLEPRSNASLLRDYAAVLSPAYGKRHGAVGSWKAGGTQGGRG